MSVTFICPVPHICDTPIYFFPDHHSDLRLILAGQGNLPFRNSKISNFFKILKLLGSDFKKLAQILIIFGPNFLHLDKIFFKQKIYV